MNHLMVTTGHIPIYEAKWIGWVPWRTYTGDPRVLTFHDQGYVIHTLPPTMPERRNAASIMPR